MKDKDIRIPDEPEFDRFLEDLTQAPPPPEIARELTPWSVSMGRILWGVGLTMMTLNFWNLDILLPGIGMLQLLLGFRALRRENRWFRAGYAAAWLRLLWWLGGFAVNVTVFADDAPVRSFLSYGAWIMVIPQLGMVLSLRNGIRAVQQKAGLPPHGGTGLVVWHVIIIALGAVQYSGIAGWGMVIAYVCILRNLSALSRELDEAGYAISLAPVRIGDSAVRGIYAAVIAVIVVVCYGFLGRYPMDWQPQEVVSDPAVETVRQELTNLGFPGEILEDLTAEELLACAGADYVLVDQRDYDMDQGRGIGTPEEIRAGKAALLTEDQAQRQLRITYVGLRFSGEREQWKLIHHFRWLEPSFCGTEAIQLWPYAMSSWRVTGDFTGRVLYDREGVTRISPYHFLGPVTYDSSGLFPFLGGSSTDVFAAFSMPDTGTNHRGYVIYDIREMMDGAIVSSWFNYVHQYSRLQFPVQTAMQCELTTSPNFGWGFRTVQTAFQFTTHEEIPGLI